jgi:hypothetical protein
MNCIAHGLSLYVAAVPGRSVRVVVIARDKRDAWKIVARAYCPDRPRGVWPARTNERRVVS